MLHSVDWYTSTDFWKTLSVPTSSVKQSKNSNYQPTLHNTPEERISHLRRGWNRDLYGSNTWI